MSGEFVEEVHRRILWRGHSAGVRRPHFVDTKSEEPTSIYWSHCSLLMTEDALRTVPAGMNPLIPFGNHVTFEKSTLTVT